MTQDLNTSLRSLSSKSAIRGIGAKTDAVFPMSNTLSSEEEEALRNILFSAVITKNKEQVLSTLQKGVDVNKKWHGEHLMRYAAQTASPQIMQLLIDKGLSLRGDKEALLTAIDWENNQTAKVLIQNGFELNFIDGQGNSAVTLAAGNEKMIDVLSVLIQKGARLSLKKMKSVLGEAAAANNMKAVERLLAQNVYVDEKETVNHWFREATPLIRATEANAFPVLVKALIKAGADVNYSYDNCSQDSGTPLINATHHLNVPSMRLLINAKADVNGQNVYGTTPLMALVRLGGRVTANMTAAASLLLMNGADLSLKDSFGKTVYTYLKESLLPIAERKHLLILFDEARKRPAVEKKPRTVSAVVRAFSELNEKDRKKVLKAVCRKASFGRNRE